MMNILVTIDSNYVRPLKVMLKSLFVNNQGEKFAVHLMHASLGDAELDDIGNFVEADGQVFVPVRIDDASFDGAPVLLHYTKAMYYRLLAHKFLPQTLDRILYLDPDILVINPVRVLYETPIGPFLYAAAFHSAVPAKEINRIRLFPYEIESYYNSGVLLMNLARQRREIDEKEIFEFVDRNRSKLFMPDQDIINALYTKKIKALDEKLYNYDVRYYSYHKLASNGVWDMERVIRNTVVLHFCGKRKPWKKGYIGRFDSLFRHYEKLALPDRES